MATKNPDNVKTRKGKEGDTYYENPALAARLKAKGIKAEAGKASGRKDNRMAKNRQYVERKKSAPTKRTTQPVARPQNVQGPLMQNGGYGNGPTPPAQTFAQNGQQRPQGQYGPMQGPMMQGGQYGQQAPSMPAGAPPQPQYNPLPNYNVQPRPSAFGQQMNPVSNAAYGMGQWLGNQYNKWGRGW
jgi:hypothetical protein